MKFPKVRASSSSRFTGTLRVEDVAVPSWVTDLAAAGSGDLPNVVADFANDRYYINGVGEVAIGDIFLNNNDSDLPFAPGAEPEGYLGPDGLQGGAGDIYLTAAAQTAAGLVGTFIFSIDIEEDQPFNAAVSLRNSDFDDLVEWDFVNDDTTNAIRDISGDQDDEPLMDLTALTVGPATLGGTYSLSNVAGSINGEAAVFLDDLPAAYGDRAHLMVQTAYGTWFATFIVYPPQNDVDLSTMTGV